MRLHKRKLGFICSFVGLLMASLMLGLFSGTALRANADSFVTVSMKYGFKVDGGETTWIQTISQSTSVDKLNSVTPNDLFKSNFADQYRSPYTMYDEFDIFSQMLNQTMTLEAGSQRLKDVLTVSPSLTVEEINEEITSDELKPLKGSTVEFARIKEDANTHSEPQKDENGTYKLPDFFIYLKPNNHSTTIKYVTPDPSLTIKDRVVSGYVGEDPATIKSPEVAGYEPDQKSVKVDFAKAGDYTTIVHYNKPGSNTGSTPTADQASLTADKAATVVTGQSVNAATFNAKATDRDGKDIPVTVDTSKVNFKVAGTYPVTLSAGNGKSVTAMLTVKAKTADLGIVAQKKSAILAIKPIYLYQKPTFNKHQRLAKYVKAPRGERPMFVVLGYAHSKNGLLRYRVKDVNHKSKTDGKIGYTTANSAFVTPAYYQKMSKRVKVLSKSGVNEYRKASLTGKVKHLKKNQTVKVVGIEHHNLTTRFKLSNGHYITANKNLVMIVK